MLHPVSSSIHPFICTTPLHHAACWASSERDAREGWMCFVEGLLFLDRRHRCRNTSEEAFNGDSLRTVSPVSQGAWTFFLCALGSIPPRPTFWWKAWLDVTDTGLIIHIHMFGSAPALRHGRANGTAGCEASFQGKKSPRVLWFPSC